MDGRTASVNATLSAAGHIDDGDGDAAAAADNDDDGCDANTVS